VEKVDKHSYNQELCEESVFKGAIPYWADKDPLFMEFLYTRDQIVREKMPFMHQRVTKASREILKVDICEPVEDFRAYLCPVRVKVGNEFTEPIILTYCKWGQYSPFLYWPMNMIPLTNEERKQVLGGLLKMMKYITRKGSLRFYKQT
jgi:hypothetical protein